ncbi:MAG: hypothetical protein HY551_06200 [Elusimicrobia bacterium]|nr:hypothetical protein [Elusimicrobiota bacterium]
MGSRSNSPRLASARLLPLFWMGLGALAVIASLRIDRIRRASSVPVLAEIPTQAGLLSHQKEGGHRASDPKAGSLDRGGRALPEAGTDFSGGNGSEGKPEKTVGGTASLREAVGPMRGAPISQKTPRGVRDASRSVAPSPHSPEPSRRFRSLRSKSVPSNNGNPRTDARNVDVPINPGPHTSPALAVPPPSKAKSENASSFNPPITRRAVTRFSELRKLASELGDRAREILRTHLWDGRISRGRMRAGPHHRPPLAIALGRPLPNDLRRRHYLAIALGRPPHPGDRKTGPSDRKIPGRSTVRRMLKQGFLRPPSNALRPPDLKRIQAEAARPSPQEGLLKFLNPPASDVEAIFPPEGAAAKESGTPPKNHWHATIAGRLWHAGPAWAFAHGDGWVWLVCAKKRWWVLARPDQPLVWHQSRWWWKKPEGWFLLHEGEPWAYRQFQNLRRDGLVHPATGMRILYGKDGRRALVEIPGQDRISINLETNETQE